MLGYIFVSDSTEKFVPIYPVKFWYGDLSVSISITTTFREVLTGLPNLAKVKFSPDSEETLSENELHLAVAM